MNRGGIPRRQARRSDPRLVWVLGGAGILILVLTLVATMGGGKSPQEGPLERVSILWKIMPVWEPGTTRPRTHQKGSSVPNAAIYLDVSEPMGGFLPPPGFRGEVSGFREVVNLIPGYLVQVASSSQSLLQWFPVAREVGKAMPQPKALGRDLFAGGESRLNEAIRHALQKFDAGELEAAVFITDLVATEELAGAMGVAKALSDRMSSPELQHGDFHVGLLGIKAPYWGVFRDCPNNDGRGCWFSEQVQDYLPIPSEAKSPFFVLILGRRYDDVQQIGGGLLKAIKDLELEARWSLLSDVVRDREVPGECRAHRLGHPEEPQFALMVGGDSGFECVRDEVIEIQCAKPKEIPLVAERLQASWPGARSTIEGESLKVQLDCAELRKKRPEVPLMLELEGPPQPMQTWDDWSSDTDDKESDLGKTLQLKLFLEKVRPRPKSMKASSNYLLLLEGEK